MLTIGWFNFPATFRAKDSICILDYAQNKTRFYVCIELPPITKEKVDFSGIA